MVASLNFGLLQPVDLSQAVQAFDAGRGRRLQQQNADTQQAQVAAQIAKQQADADSEMKRKAALKQGARALIFGDLGAAATPEAMPSAPAEAPTAPMQAAPVSAPMMTPAAPVAPAGDAVAEPMATVSAPRINPIWDQLIDADPEQAIALFEKSQKMTDDERKRVSDSYGMLAAATVDLTKIPYEQRRAALEQMAPMLEAQGVPRNLIEGFDPTDQNLAGAANNALGLKEVFAIRDRAADNEREERKFTYQQTNDATNRAVTIRGQNLTDARAREANRLGGIKLTEGERTTGFLANRLAGALTDISGATKDAPGAAGPGVGEWIAGMFGEVARNNTVSANRQQVLNAQLDALDAGLTLGTGAAYTREQLEGFRGAYFPQLGDAQSTIRGKKERFVRLLESAAIKAGNAAPPALTQAIQQGRAELAADRKAAVSNRKSGAQPSSGWGKLQVER